MTDKLYLYLKYKVSYYPLFMGGTMCPLSIHNNLFLFIYFFDFVIFFLCDYTFLNQRIGFLWMFWFEKMNRNQNLVSVPIVELSIWDVRGASTFPYLFSPNSLKIWIATILEYKLRCCSFEDVIYELEYLKKCFFF